MSSPVVSYLHPRELRSVGELAAVARAADGAGVTGVWLTQSLRIDPLAALAAVAPHHPSLRFGTAISLMSLYGPVALAGTARALATAAPGRVTIGIGAGDPAALGPLAAPPGASGLGYLADYLDVVQSLVRDGGVDHSGEAISAALEVGGGTSDIAFAVGALRTGAARVAGGRGLPLVTWLCPPAQLRRLRDAGQGQRVVAGVPWLVADPDDDAAVLAAGEQLAAHLGRPHYRAMLAQAGVSAEDGVVSVRILREIAVIGLTPDDALGWVDADEIALAPLEPASGPGLVRRISQIGALGGRAANAQEMQPLDVVRRYVERIWNAGEFERLPEFVGAAHRFRAPDGSLVLGGVDDFAAAVRSVRDLFSELHMEVTDAVVDGERIAWRWKMRGRVNGMSSRTLEGVALYEIRDGLIVARDGVADLSPLLTVATA